MKNLRVIWKQLLTAGGMALLILYLLGVATKISDLSKLRAEFISVSTGNAEYQANYERISAEVAFANTDAFVDAWARENAGMMQPGDRPIVVYSSGAAFIEETIEIENQIGAEISNWDVWMLWLFP